MVTNGGTAIEVDSGYSKYGRRLFIDRGIERRGVIDLGIYYYYIYLNRGF